MSVSRGQEITQADLDALATLANTKMPRTSPSRPFEFPFMDDTVDPPTNLTGTPSATGSMQSCLRVYSYKIISGRKHYSRRFAVVGVGVLDDSTSIVWSWTAPASGVDGYVLIRFGGSMFVEPVFGNNGLYDHWWRTQTATSYTETTYVDGFDGSVGTETDFNVGKLCPVDREAWQRELLRIKFILYRTKTSSPSWLVSGPWCVTSGSTLEIYPSYGHRPVADAEFWCAEDDIGSDIPIDVVEGNGGTPSQSGGNPYTFSFSVNVTYAARLTISLNVSRTTGGSITWAFSATGGSVVSVTPASITNTSANNTVVVVTDVPAGSTTINIGLTFSGGIVAPTGRSASVTAAIHAEYAPSSVLGVHPSSSLVKTSVAFSPSMLSSTFPSGTVDGTLLRFIGQVNGVWVAKTLPVFCLNQFLESKLPFAEVFSGKGTTKTDSPRAIAYKEFSPDVDVVAPAVNARVSIWPVFRDTEILTWKVLSGTGSDFLVPFFSNGYFFSVKSQTLAPGQHLSYSLFLADSIVSGKIEAEGTTLPIYFSQTEPPDPDNPTTYDGVVSSPMRFPSDYAAVGGSNLFYTIKNNTASVVTFNIRTTSFYTIHGWNPGPTPLFFRRWDENRGDFERYSYNFVNPKNLSLGIRSNIPLAGYCIFEIKVQRKPSGEPAVVTSVGTADLVVKIGLMRGTTNETPGTFEELLSTTILAGEPSVTEAVFWPVLGGGAALIYQCTEEVQVFAQANFQPEFTTRYVVDTSSPTSGINKMGEYVGDLVKDSRVLLFNNLARPQGATYTESKVAYPPAACSYNDLETIINTL